MNFWKSRETLIIHPFFTAIKNLDIEDLQMRFAFATILISFSAALSAQTGALNTPQGNLIGELSDKASAVRVFRGIKGEF